MGIHSYKYTTYNIHENTPSSFYEQLNKEFLFDFDPCPANPEFDGLNLDWNGNVYINPPYGKQVKIWLLKAIEQIEKKKVKLCVFLLPSYTDVKWFHEIVLEKASEIRFIKGRLKFGSHKETAPFASLLAIFKNDSEL